MITLNKEKNAWIDINGNSWNATYFTETEARNCSLNLENCTGCIDCDGCIDCVDCRDCRYCDDCKNCVNCEDCVECEHCKDCFNCKECERYVGLKNSKFCS